MAQTDMKHAKFRTLPSHFYRHSTRQCKQKRLYAYVKQIDSQAEYILYGNQQEILDNVEWI